MKSKIPILAIVLAVVCIAVVFMYGQKISKTNKNLDVERYKRMVAEEKLSQAYSKVQSVNIQLRKKQDQIESMKALLEKSQIAVSNLQDELNKVMEINTQLQTKVKTVQPPKASSSEVPPVPQGE